MNKQLTMMIGIFTIVASIAGMWFWIYASRPDETQIDAQSKHIKPVDSSLLSKSSMDNIENKTIYGNIPVAIQESYDNQDIFN